MRLVGFELFVVGELDVDSAPAQLRYATAEVRHHCHRRDLLRHFEERLEDNIVMSDSKFTTLKVDA